MKDMRVTFSTPHNIWQRWIGAFHKALESSNYNFLSPKFWYRVGKQEVAILPKLTLGLINNSTYDGSEIYNEQFDSGPMKAFKSGVYMARESIAMISFLDSTTQLLTGHTPFTPDNIKSQYAIERERMIKNSGKLLKLASAEIWPWYIGLKTPEERRKAKKIIRTLRDYSSAATRGMKSGVGKNTILRWRKQMNKDIERNRER
jgi:hypothetical protein